MIHRTIDLDIDMKCDGSAKVVLYDAESGDSTSMTYDEDSIDNGSFEKWLVDNVTGWIEWMGEELENDSENAN